MTTNAAGKSILLGDPAPWFGAPLIGDGAFNLQVAAGRWIVLSFLGSPTDPRADQELSELLRDAQLFDEDKIIFCGILTAPPQDATPYVAMSTPAISFIADYDGAISRSFGAAAMPRTVVLDPMLRAVADIAWDHAAGHAETVRNVLRSLPAVDDSAGVPLTAPVLDRAARARFRALRLPRPVLRQARRQGFRLSARHATARRRRWSITGSSAATI